MNAVAMQDQVVYDLLMENALKQTVVLFHSAFGLRPAVGKFADRLRANGHAVYTPDLFDGAVFDTVEDGVRHAESLGIPLLIGRAKKSLENLPSEIFYAGFSMGARGAILMHAALPPTMLGVKVWPPVPVQIHYAEQDPWVESAHVQALSEAVTRAKQKCMVYRYPGSGHLFADEDLSDYHAESAEAMIERVLDFLDHAGD